MKEVLDNIVAQLHKHTYSWGSFTNIGGGYENQDEVNVIHLPSTDTKVILVADGHGKQYGKFFAQKTVHFLKEYICANFEFQFNEAK